MPRAAAGPGAGAPTTTSMVSSGSGSAGGSAFLRPRRLGGASPESTGSTTSGGAGGGGGGRGGAVRAEPATRPMEAIPRPTAATEVRVLIRVPRNSTQANRVPAPQVDSSRARGAAMIAPTRPPDSCRTAGAELAGGAPLARWSRPSPPTSTASSPMVTRPATMSSLGRRPPEQGQGQPADQQRHRVGAVAEQAAEQQGHEHPEPAPVLEPDPEGQHQGEHDQEDPLDVALVGRQGLAGALADPLGAGRALGRRPPAAGGRGSPGLWSPGSRLGHP